MLGFSRTPIREAAMRLQGEGLVQIVPRHGIRIVPTSISDIKHIYQVLISLESTAAGLVASRKDIELAPLVDACEAHDRRTRTRRHACVGGGGRSLSRDARSR